LAVVVAALVAVLGCSGEGAATASRSGNARVAPDEEARSVRPAPAQDGSTAAAPGSTEDSLSSTELGAVYQFIVQRYVEQVDHRQLVEAAIAGVHDAGIQSNALPLDLALIDLVPVPAGDPADDWSAFARGYDALVQKYPAWTAAARPDWAVLRKMLGTLNDGHSLFMDPDEVRRMNETAFSGVGVRVTRMQEDDPPYVREVFPNSPAAAAGVRPGDQIQAVDGTSTAGRSLTDIVGTIRGAQGSRVTLSVLRGQSPGVDIQISRAAVDSPRVEASVRGGVLGVLRIRSFGDGVPEQVQQVLTQGRNRGAQAWILDLRGNPGGSLESMARVATNFIDARPVGLAVDRSGQSEQIMAPGRAAVPRFPFVVLVDHETSSAAELLASAIKEYQAAPLVGTRTAGSVGLAAPQPLSDGSMIQVTVRRLTSPSGADIDEHGVEPDVAADLTIDDLQRGDDPQMMKAIEVLMGMGGPTTPPPPPPPTLTPVLH
jgi:carboxyl-terminal processing protease